MRYRIEIRHQAHRMTVREAATEEAARHALRSIPAKPDEISRALIDTNFCPPGMRGGIRFRKTLETWYGGSPHV